MCVIKIQVINCNLNVCGHTVQQSPPPYDLLTSLLVPLALCLEPTGICMCTPWTRGWRLMNILFKYTLKRKGKSPLESVPIWISLSYFFASGLQKRSRSPPMEIQENLWTFGEYLIKTHHTISQILKGWRNVKYCFNKQHLVQKFKQHGKEIHLETQAPPCFYTPDVKTSCSFTSAYISNLWTICLKRKSCCI